LIDTDKADNQIKGIFSSETQAQQAQEHLNTDSNFEIKKHTLDQLS